MQCLNGESYVEAAKFMFEAMKVAKDSTCLRSKCGSIIVSKDGKIIGRGFNSPPGNLESQRKCSVQKKSYHEKVTDKTCCVHAEQRAIFDAMANNPRELANSTLYFIRISQENEILKSGKPYCTHCSKLSLDTSLEKFVLWHEEGICSYTTEEYNLLSFECDDKE